MTSEADEAELSEISTMFRSSFQDRVTNLQLPPVPMRRHLPLRIPSKRSVDRSGISIININSFFFFNCIFE
jgi:hypothetical protein